MSRHLSRPHAAASAALFAVLGLLTGSPQLDEAAAAPAAALLGDVGPHGAESSSASAATRCTALRGLHIPARALSLETRGGIVTQTAMKIVVVSSGDTVEYCQADATVRSVDRTAPDIEMRVALPDSWNRRTMQFGGGGFNGTIPDVNANVPFGRSDRPAPIARGFAVFASDSGHQADPLFVPSPSLDGSFGASNEALRNFATGAALKKTRDAAMFVIGHRYRHRPVHNYFAGGSTGGREALVVAQRWPHAYDGVISAYPAWNNMAEILFLGHLAQVLSKPGAFLDTAKQSLLYTSVVDACDGKDGLRDRVVSDERGCHYDPTRLRCAEGQDAGDSCLSDRQIHAVREMSSPWRWGYRLASGERSYPGFPFLSGADMRTPLLGFGSRAPANPMPKDSGYGLQYWEQWVRYFLTRDADHNALAVDPRHPGRWMKRIQRLSVVEDRNNADLRPFLRAGGKLILLHGSADELVSHRSTATYFRRVVHIIGRQRTHSFLRHYVVPGANHANTAPAFAASWDSLTALQRWVENDRAPRHPVVRDASQPRTRPLCEYPSWPRYRSGDPQQAASFRCVD